MRFSMSNFVLLLALAIIPLFSCRARNDENSSELSSLSTKCGSFISHNLKSDPKSLASGTSLISESMGNPTDYRKYYVIALGVFKRPNSRVESDLEQFAKKVSAAYSQPAVAHWQFARAGLASHEEFPTEIQPGSKVEREYEVRFAKILDRALERYHCKSHPVFYFNLTGLDPSLGQTLTSRELRVILSHSVYANRTQFFQQNKPVSIDDVRIQFEAMNY